MSEIGHEDSPAPKKGVSWRKLLGRVPVFGQLTNCRRHHLVTALKETFPNVGFSLAPLLMAWLMSLLFDVPDALRSPLYIFRNGELLMAALSAVAPLFYIVSTTFPSEASPASRPIPSAFLFQFVLIAIVFVAASMFPLFQLANVLDAQGFEGGSIFSPILNNVLWFSSAVYMFAVIMVFVAMAYREMISGQTADPFREGDANARNTWSEEVKTWRT